MFTNVRETLAVLFVRLQALTSGFRANARGNVAVITALSAIPIISAVGCVVDYSMATMIKTKLQAAPTRRRLQLSPAIRRSLQPPRR
jgi:hypothetical protein